MAYFISYRMISGNAMSTCFTARDAVSRHAELVLAGAGVMGINHDGTMITFAELKGLVVPGELCKRPDLPGGCP